MMKKLFIFPVVVLMYYMQLSAQVLYPTQPEEGYYQNLKKIVMPNVPTEQQLINAKITAIPNNFKDTLIKYDWYEIANYYVYDKSYDSYFSSDLEEREVKYANNEFGFIRYTPAGITYDMKLDYYKNGSIKVYTTTFEESTAVKLVEVKKVNGKSMRVTSVYGETEMQEIVSYKDGLMIMKIRQSANNNIKMFIIAYYAVPKTF